MELAGKAQFSMRQSAHLENLMISVERVLEYGQLTSEAPLDNGEKGEKMEKTQLHNAIEFRNVSLKYANNDSYILRDMTFRINQGEKVRHALFNCQGILTTNLSLDWDCGPDRGWQVLTCNSPV
jgi:ATP-binding cassette subfamily C (CFTR/MRP) protein 4